jgi:hypothetical protein
MSKLATLEKLEIALKRSKKEAESLGDDLLVYVISMAILRVQRNCASVGEAGEAKPCRLRVVAA